MYSAVCLVGDHSRFGCQKTFTSMYTPSALGNGPLNTPAVCVIIRYEILPPGPELTRLRRGVRPRASPFSPRYTGQRFVLYDNPAIQYIHTYYNTRVKLICGSRNVFTETIATAALFMNNIITKTV